MALHLIADSASDLPKWMQEDYDIKVIPTPVLIDGIDYLDGKTIDTKEFYQILEDDEREVSTYHINPAMFEEAFLPYAKNGEEVLYLCFSTGIAATFNAAHIAKDSLLSTYPSFNLTIIDSRCASAGFGLLVYKLAQMKMHGAGKEILVDAADFYRQHIRHIFTVKTLKYLVKGGRLPRFKGQVATVLELHPIITIDSNGALKAIKNVRGRKPSLKALVEYVAKTSVGVEHQTIAFCHGDDEDAMSFVIERMKEQVPYQSDYISLVGCAIGAHTGRGIVGICYLDASESRYKDYLNQ